MSTWADLPDADPLAEVTTQLEDTNLEETEAGDANVLLDKAAEELKAIEQKKKEELGDDPEVAADLVDMRLNSGQVEVITSKSQNNEATIYNSDASFKDVGLSEDLLLGIAEMGFTKPSKIQAVAIPLILQGYNLIAQAHHGSGKTATFSLGMLSQVDPKIHEPQAICLVNTRELALQVLDVIRRLGSRSGVTAYCAVKGISMEPIHQHIVVGTPGSIKSRLARNILNPAKIRILVLDEADVLVDESTIQQSSNNPAASAGRGGRGGGRGGRGGRGGFAGQQRSNDGIVQQSIYISKACPQAQVLLFSATFSTTVMEFAERVAPDAAKIRLRNDQLRLTNIKQGVVTTKKGEQGKLVVLKHILETVPKEVKKTIIFCNNVASTKAVHNYLVTNQHQVSTIYGSKSEFERQQALEDFRRGQTSVLISTNLLSRGIDVPDVSLVVNYDIPVHYHSKAGDVETYMHRIGRCGRFGRKGIAISITADDNTRKVLEDICNVYKTDTSAANTASTPSEDVILTEIKAEAETYEDDLDNFYEFLA